MSIFSRAAHDHLGLGRLIISPVIVPRTSAGNFSAAAMPSSSDPIQQQLEVFSCISGGFRFPNVIASPSLRIPSTLDVMKRSEHLGAAVGAARL